ncbi:Ubiquitin-conjugating enzyme E2 Q2 [Sciurus carolinensis]|uniref:Ubiquitin-conjugating enzyme E2 Q2 n=1 Tax=Sciurus carolinensis TaxID=30640 RepID=A0AA41T4G9_SCICA|nr:Ubiquitin-conjugating enzyme E2 Q2 [Sciurus carolinensis]
MWVRQPGGAEPQERVQGLVPRGGGGCDGGAGPRSPPSGDEGKMSLSGIKTKLKFLASIFDKKQERLHIVSWELDELHCQFLVPLLAPPGSPHSPHPPLTLHCNFTESYPSSSYGLWTPMTQL